MTSITNTNNNMVATQQLNAASAPQNTKPQTDGWNDSTKVALAVGALALTAVAVYALRQYGESMEKPLLLDFRSAYHDPVSCDDYTQSNPFADICKAISPQVTPLSYQFENPWLYTNTKWNTNHKVYNQYNFVNKSFRPNNLICPATQQNGTCPVTQSSGVISNLNSREVITLASEHAIPVAAMIFSWYMLPKVGR